VVIAKIKAAPKPTMIHFLGLLPDSLGSGSGGSGAGAGASAEHDRRASAVAKMMTTTAGGSGEAALAASKAEDDKAAVTGLIGGGVSYGGTGATPQPGKQARSTLPPTMADGGMGVL
jgi:hypothetical protein